jgi:hypothetical protein
VDPFFVMLNSAGMSSISVRINSIGGYYREGVGFDVTKWLGIMAVYKAEDAETGACTIARLAEKCGVSLSSANKAIQFAREDEIVMKERGRPKQGLGSSFGMTSDHHMLIYRLFLENPSRPLEDYSVQFEYLTGIVASTSFFSRCTV